jgi:glyoxylase-like metal-dependent hydrolase (beta-lactamase superfamily II)
LVDRRTNGSPRIATVGAEPQIRAFFDEPTNTVSYLVWNPDTQRGVVIDPVLDFDPASGLVDDGSVKELLDSAEQLGITIDWVLETHVHADHLSGAPLIKQRTGAKVAIGEHVRDVQTIFRPIFGADDVKADGADFDRLLKDGDRIETGGLGIEVLYTPGHTPACVSYRIGDAVFVGDTMFMPDYGTARTDFPGGDARQLYRSIRKILALPAETRLFMCHDYKAPGRDHFAWEATVAEQRAANKHIHDGVGEDEFVAMREERDRGLCTPRLLIPSIQVNMRAGRFPPAEQDGVRYLRVPVRLKDGANPMAIC